VGTACGSSMAGSVEISSIKCVVDSTLCYTTFNVIPLLVQKPLIPPPTSRPEFQHESHISALSPPAVGSQIHDQCSVLPVEDPKSCMSMENKIRQSASPLTGGEQGGKYHTFSGVWSNKGLLWVGSDA
jgi:hypothetical protein